MAELKAADKLAKGTKGQLKGTTISGGVSVTPPEKQPTLAEQGIDKNLADTARKLAAMPDRRHSGREKR